ncbi:MAG: hypothetical protein ACRC2B_09460 [Rubrivivax sp.]
MFDFDPGKRRLHFRTGLDAQEVSLPFARLRRITLLTPLTPLTPIARSGGVARARKHDAGLAQVRDYRLQQVGDAPAPALVGRTAGHVETAEGMFLFTPVDNAGALQRVFVPRTAYTRCEFGASTEEMASRHWIASPAQLLEAIARQHARPVKTLAQSLLELGLLTQAQLDRSRVGLDGRTALGESLVGTGQISRNDLQTALAHTMGFALVDLARFPLDPAAMALLPPSVANSYRVVPLLRYQGGLVVAVDRPARVIKLRRLDAYAQMPIVPVLALRSQILLALNSQSGAGWNLNPGGPVAPVATMP